MVRRNRYRPNGQPWLLLVPSADSLAFDFEKDQAFEVADLEEGRRASVVILGGARQDSKNRFRSSSRSAFLLDGEDVPAAIFYRYTEWVGQLDGYQLEGMIYEHTVASVHDSWNERWRLTMLDALKLSVTSDRVYHLTDRGWHLDVGWVSDAQNVGSIHVSMWPSNIHMMLRREPPIALDRLCSHDEAARAMRLSSGEALDNLRSTLR